MRFFVEFPPEAGQNRATYSSFQVDVHFLLLPRGPRGAGRDHLLALLAGHGRLIRRRKRRVVTARAWLPLLRRPGLIGRLTASGAEQVWVSDSTYVRLRSGWSYRRPIRDLYSHKIVGACLHPDRSACGTLTARHPGPGRPHPAAAVGSSLGPGLAVRRPRRGLAGKPRRGPGHGPMRRPVRKRGGRAGQRHPAGCMWPGRCPALPGQTRWWAGPGGPTTSGARTAAATF